MIKYKSKHIKRIESFYISCFRTLRRNLLDDQSKIPNGKKNLIGKYVTILQSWECVTHMKTNTNSCVSFNHLTTWYSKRAKNRG